MPPQPSFRTIITAILSLAVVSVGGTLSLTTYNNMLANSRSLANTISSEVATSSIANIDNIREYCERGVKVFANIASRRARDPLMPFMAREFWNHVASGAYKNIALKCAFASDGHGFFIYKGDMELVQPGNGGGFVATSVSTGKSRPVKDMRKLDWFEDGIRHAGQGTLGWSPNRKFVNLSNLEGPRGFSLYTAFGSPDGSTPAEGVMAVSGSTGWIRNKLVESLGAHGNNSFAFVLELDQGNGSPILVAHTDKEIGERISANPEAVHTSECGSPLTLSLSEPVDWLELKPNQSRTERVVTPEGAFNATYTLLQPGANAYWILCHAFRESEIVNPAQRHLMINLALTFGILAIVLAPAFWFAMVTARRLEQLTAIAEATGKLDLSERKQVHSGIREISKLAGAIDSMRSGLKSFIRYVPEDLLKRYLKPGNIAGLDSETVPVTILFSDIKDFSTVAERIDPMSLVKHLNDYLEILSTEVSRHGGTVDKYIGDAVMSFWNAPIRVPGHARQAFSAALVGRKALDTANARWKAAGLPVFVTRMGIHTGEVIVGNIGSSVRLNYTIIGDAVNLASRLEGLNKQYGTSILVSEPARLEAGDDFLTRPVDLVAVKGKTEPVLVHELIGWRADCSPDQVDLAVTTTLAHDAYRARRFSDARDAYAAIIARWIHDGVSQRMMERADELSRVPPPANWSGVHRTPLK